jgi:hypothetical protein
LLHLSLAVNSNSGIALGGVICPKSFQHPNLVSLYSTFPHLIFGGPVDIVGVVIFLVGVVIFFVGVGVVILGGVVGIVAGHVRPPGVSAGIYT